MFSVCIRFYVNTFENPPRSSWVHPLGPAPPSPQPGGYAPPSGPPPPSGSPYPPSGGYNQGYGQPPPQQWSSSPPPGPGYYGGAPAGGYGGYGGAPPQENRGECVCGPRTVDVMLTLRMPSGWFGSNSPQPQVVQQAPPKKSGPGMGTALLAGEFDMRAPDIPMLLMRLDM